MNLFGVEIKHPSPKELGLATFIIMMFLVFSLLNGERADSLFPSLAAVSAGVISASFGISPGKGGRACVLLLVIATISYTFMRMLTGQLLTN